MITDKQLMRLCLTIALASIAGLIAYIELFQQPAELQIAEISRNDIGRLVLVTGAAEDASLRSDTLFIELSDNGSTISVIAFRPENVINITLIYTNATLEVTGKVSIYRNELEIVAEKISVIK